MPKTCRKCSVELSAGVNWTGGQERAKNYICQSCMSAVGRAHYKAHADRALELQRKRLTDKDKKAQAAANKSTYYAKNKEKWVAYRETQKRKEQTLASHRASRICTWARARAAKRGYEFSLTAGWIESRLIAGKCEVSGIPFEMGSDVNGLHPWAPSVDRIDSDLGYTPDNCRLVVWIFNLAKAHWQDSDVLRLAQALVRQ